jgi:hypothetical protein
MFGGVPMKAGSEIRSRGYRNSLEESRSINLKIKNGTMDENVIK